MDTINVWANGWGQWHAQGENITPELAHDAIMAELNHRGDADEGYPLSVERCDVHSNCWAEVA